VTRRTLRTDVLARVEGEGAMYVHIDGSEVRDVELRIYEPPRFFEAFLRGRRFTEVPDITARICGICPVAYQMSSCLAMEDACGVEVGDGIRALRRLLYCGEWVESHALHVYMLHAPDFLGYPGIVELARDHPAIAEAGLRMKKAGNTIMRVVGGREIHPVNVRVGGFYRAPSRAELRALLEPLREARQIALDTVRWTADLPFPDFEGDYELVALRQPGEYPVDRGRIVSNRGVDTPAAGFDEHFAEEHVAHSNALHARARGRGAYLAGPLARFRLGYDELSPLAREAAEEAGLDRDCANPFRSIVVRAVEIVQALDDAVTIVEAYRPPERPFVDVAPRHAVGHGVTEAPRGMLYHRYEIDDDGTILDARIVPPTSQNQLQIEHDMRRFVQANVELDDDTLRHRCEQAIRNYDPCISCATHFLDLHVERT
jgi:coenzyme F420-reducing hydrogenase alpha subunit